LLNLISSLSRREWSYHSRKWIGGQEIGPNIAGLFGEFAFRGCEMGIWRQNEHHFAKKLHENEVSRATFVILALQ
jgi:hypothetical protein